MIIRGFKDEKLVLKIEGRACGYAKVESDQKMVPIISKHEIIGSMILETFWNFMYHIEKSYNEKEEPIQINLIRQLW